MDEERDPRRDETARVRPVGRAQPTLGEILARFAWDAPLADDEAEPPGS